MQPRKVNCLITAMLGVLLITNSASSLYAQTVMRYVSLDQGKVVSDSMSNGSSASILTDARGQGKKHSYRVNAPIVLNIITTGSTCQFTNGSLIVEASGGVWPYRFSLGPGWERNTGNFPNVPGGTYTLTVTDAVGESTVTVVNIPNTFSAPSLIYSSYTPVSSCTAHDASITLLASGGTAPYTYSMDGINFQTSPTFSNLYAGFYEFIVKDANGCLNFLSSFNVQFLFANNCNTTLALSYSYSSCVNEGQISMYNGQAGNDYTFSMDGVNFTPFIEATGLPSGLHIIYVKNPAGQITLMAIYLFQNCTINLDYIGVDAACQQYDGQLTITASNGTTPYTYTVDGINYQTSNVFTGLPPGEYNVTVRDAMGVSSSLGAVVYDRCPKVTLNSTGESCIKNDGTITATADKGTAPYQYSLDGVNFQSSNVFIGLSTGSYTVTLKDALGYTSTATIAVNDVCISVMVFTTPATCSASNGSLNAVASLGTAPYSYSIDGLNFQSTGIFNGLAPGPITVTAKDAMGNSGTSIIIIGDSPAPQLATQLTPAGCGNVGGSITFSGTGGRIPYSYSLDNQTYQSNNIIGNLAPGNYTAWIKDANGCTASQPVTILLNCPTVTTSFFNETCGSHNGSITATGANGTTPYQFSLDGTNFQASGSFSGLAAGNYVVTIKDAQGITNTSTVVLINFCPTITAVPSPRICGVDNGVISVQGGGGTAPYEFSIDGVNFQSAAVFTGLISGTYTVTVRDANGLTNTTTAIITHYPVAVVDYVATAASCLDNDGTLTALASAATPPYTYSLWDVVYQPENKFINLPSGTYNLLVQDQNGCKAVVIATVPRIDNLTLTTSSPVTICEGTSTTLHPLSNAASFAWSPAGTLSNALAMEPTASPLTDTKYYVTAKLGSCSRLDSVMVFVDPAPVATVGEGSIICFGRSANLTGSGGLSYSWQPADFLDDPHSATPVSIQPTRTIKYALQVTDGNSCQSLNDASVLVTVTPAPRIFAGNDTSIVMNQLFQLQAIDVNNSGFTDYTWLPATGMNDSRIPNPQIVIDRETRYTITAKTAAGCEGSDEINIKVYRGPDIFVPTAFSPNKDGKNDVLFATPVGIRTFRHFSVYNRSGQRVFTTTNPAIGWDGYVKARGQSTEVFVWICEGVDDKGNTIRKKGTVTLVH